MICGRVYNLRRPNWEQVDRRVITQHPRFDDDGNRITRKVVEWQRHPEYNYRAYVVLFSDGGIFAVFFTKE